MEGALLPCGARAARTLDEDSGLAMERESEPLKISSAWRAAFVLMILVLSIIALGRDRLKPKAEALVVEGLPINAWGPRL